MYGSLKETLCCEVYTKTEERVFITGTVYVLRFKKQLLSIKYIIPQPGSGTLIDESNVWFVVRAMK